MAREVVIWGSKAAVPRDFAEVKPGDALVTRYIKANSDVVYTLKKTNRRGFTRIVSYYAPYQVVQGALRNGQEQRQKAEIREKRGERRRLLGEGARASADIFLALDHPTRLKIIDAYGRTFGPRKSEYVRRAYADWQAGTVSMTHELQERLLMFLPPLLSFEGKFKIVETLWNSTRRQENLYLSMGPTSQISFLIEYALSRLKACREGVIPAQVEDALSWLSEDDSRLALQLVNRFGQEEDRLVAETLSARLAMLHEFVRQHGAAGTAAHEVRVPGLIISVQLKG
jgi:hypothetical protein